MNPNIRKWKTKTDLNSKINVSESEDLLPNKVTESCKKPLNVFNAMFCDSLVTCITQQTNLYAAQRGKENLNVREEEIAIVIAILLLSEYCRVSQRDLYWAASPDTDNEDVARVMSRNRFRAILSNLHIGDNACLNDDRHYKVKYSRHSSCVECNDISTRSIRSFDNLLFKFNVSLPLVTGELLQKTVDVSTC